MEHEKEVFEIVDERNTVIGQEYRGIVHRQGLLHRATYCFVFNRKGQLLLQKRSSQKKIGPNQWDLSLAEHLQPGESFRDAVVRGLREELGICVEGRKKEEAQPCGTQNTQNDGVGDGCRLCLVGPITPVHKRELRVGEFHDVELVQSFRLEGLDSDAEGCICFEDGEVSDVQWVDPSELGMRIGKNPEIYTDWLKAETAFLQGNMQYAPALM